MDTILLEGVSYTKAAILAKRFRYTSDYIGQLCRSGKVVCHMVGRTWYVTESSLLEHRDSRYKEIRLDEKTNNLNTFSPDSEEVLVKSRRLPANTHAPVNDKAPHFLDRLSWVQPRYVPDEAELLPQPVVKKKKILPQVPSVPAKLPVDQAEAVTVSVSSESRQPQKLKFTELPEVPLRGQVAVEAVELPSAELPLPPSSLQPRSAFSVTTKVAQAASSPSNIVTPHTPRQMSRHRPVSVRFSPAMVSDVAEAPQSTKALFAFSAVVAIIFVLFLATTSYSYTFESGNLSATVQLSWENLRLFFTKISTDL